VQRPPDGFDPDEHVEDFLLWMAGTFEGTSRDVMDAFDYLKQVKITKRGIHYVVKEVFATGLITYPGMTFPRPIEECMQMSEQAQRGERQSISADDLPDCMVQLLPAGLEAADRITEHRKSKNKIGFH